MLASKVVLLTYSTSEYLGSYQLAPSSLVPDRCAKDSSAKRPERRSGGIAAAKAVGNDFSELTRGEHIISQAFGTLGITRNLISAWAQRKRFRES
jgi:hypothetical protein